MEEFRRFCNERCAEDSVSYGKIWVRFYHELRYLDNVEQRHAKTFYMVIELARAAARYGRIGILKRLKSMRSQQSDVWRSASIEREALSHDQVKVLKWCYANDVRFFRRLHNPLKIPIGIEYNHAPQMTPLALALYGDHRKCAQWLFETFGPNVGDNIAFRQSIGTVIPYSALLVNVMFSLGCISENFLCCEFPHTILRLHSPSKVRGVYDLACDLLQNDARIDLSLVIPRSVICTLKKSDKRRLALQRFLGNVKIVYLNKLLAYRAWLLASYALRCRNVSQDAWKLVFHFLHEEGSLWRPEWWKQQLLYIRTQRLV